LPLIPSTLAAYLVVLTPLTGPAPSLGGCEVSALDPAASPADDPFDERLEAAGKDPEKLWNLVRWCEDTDRTKQARTALRRLIKVDPDHVQARKKLGHERYDGQWFTSERKLKAYKKKEAQRRAKEQGLVKYKGEWVRPDDLPLLERGLVRGPEGRWMARGDLEKLEQGWERQDLVWIAPEEFGQVEAGLWKCGDEWLTLELADRYHRRSDRPWAIPSDYLTLRSTCNREVALRAIEAMSTGVRDLVRIYGRRPALPVQVFLAANGDEFGRLCSQGPLGGFPIETRGLVESMRALFAESWYDAELAGWLGAGASWWDGSNDSGNKFGVHDARMALGLAFGDALDPSPKAVAKLLKQGGAYTGFAEQYYAEKLLPAWFRWGAASYVSRYYPDQVASGGDPFWTRKWSLENLQRQGGVPSLEEVFALELKGRAGEGQVVLGAGLVLAFMLDGDCAPVRQVHAELKAALKSGQDPDKILTKLRKVLASHEQDLRAFAGL
jgi:hypothetical protein